VRIVADTNVLVSAFVFPGGAPETVFRHALTGRIRIVTSPALLAELGRVLVDKLGLEPDLAAAAVAQVARVGDVVRPTDPVAEIAEDPSDNRVLEACAAGAAESIVSGDRHLLRLGTWQGVPILTPAQLLELLD